MQTSTAAKPLLLDYAPAPSVTWRFIRTAIRFILVGSVVVATYIWGPVVWNQSRMLYWQRQCLNFTVAANQVVYDGELVSGRTAAPPACWAEFVDSAANIGPALSGMPQFGSLVFLGQLKTPSGKVRLVAVAFTSQLNWWAHGRLRPGMSYQVWVVNPGSPLRDPEVVSQLAAAESTFDSSFPPPLPRFYFGQNDPSDPSRFSVRYKVWGQEDIVEGRIDDAGQVTLKQRNPPSTSPGEGSSSDGFRQK